MKVELIDYTGHGHTDPAERAARVLIYAKNTRLPQASKRELIAAMGPAEIAAQLDDIAKTIKSSWEFVDYAFEVILVTRAYTHQAVRSRHCSFAQEAMRVSDKSEFETRVPATVVNVNMAGEWDDLMKGIAAFYAKLKALGVPSQDARGVLPTNVLTSIMIKMNLRTFSEIVGRRDNPRAQDEYTEVVQAMAARVLEVHPWARQFLYPERTATPALSELLKEALGGKAPVDVPRVNAALKELDALKGAWG